MPRIKFYWTTSTAGANSNGQAIRWQWKTTGQSDILYMPNFDVQKADRLCQMLLCYVPLTSYWFAVILCRPCRPTLDAKHCNASNIGRIFPLTHVFILLVVHCDVCKPEVWPWRSTARQNDFMALTHTDGSSHTTAQLLALASQKA
jgi:hypothetical protein